ncbi:glycosyltransferase family 2 protein [Candidatus Contubernalis alkaliaceticus]|uniref:glycosyltransferase family 2 protein n=1 Tax=Candidatus Contubernalis alkaliaceticus TaxID=338645 RepID=UPI001F4C038B|nr:glycosyltransferase family 2 protein [Candidatus Contubernalis alkalaceticus]UNC93585.1 glycosyltransferase family 2 protein [Candidatus Contubernalis alkalaceticus]
MVPEIIFWILTAVLIYIYFGYPVIISIFSYFMTRPVVKNNEYEPFTTLIITAYNEEKHMVEKLANTLELDYPRDKLDIIVASDGSKDNTNEIVRKFIKQHPEIRLLSFKKNRGKTAAQNRAVTCARGEIIVFSDANARYRPDAVRKLVRNFYDTRVGCVCGELRYRVENCGAGEGEGLYWKYEKYLKKLESRLGNVLGANGSIYALRKDLYVPIKEDIISDFVEPLKIIEKGFRAVYEEKAVSYEDASKSFQLEFQRKVRIITRSYRGLLSVKKMLNPLKYGFLALGLFSRKLLRWYTGIFLGALFLTNLYLAFSSRGFFLFTLLFQMLFIFLALGGIISKRSFKPLLIPAYFCVVSYSSILGLVNYYRGDSAVSWVPSRK